MAKKGGKIKISKAKQKNILGGKKTKGKKTSSQTVVKARKKLVAIKKLKEKNQILRAHGKTPERAETTAQDVLDMLDDEELSYVRNADRIGDLSFCVSPAQPNQYNKKRKRKNSEIDDLEYQYETNHAKEMLDKKMVRLLLPIKVKGGLTMQTCEEDIPTSKAKTVTASTKGSKHLETQQKPEIVAEKHANQEESGKVISTAMLLARRQEKINEYRIKIGILSASFLEDPENRLRNLDSLLAMLQTNESAVSFTAPKLAAVSLVMVFQDVLPLYAISHHNQEGVKLKKDTRELQGGEANLLRRYKMFLQRLEKMVSSGLPPRRTGKSVSEAETKLGRIALDCMCKMMLSHPYFNMAMNIVNFVIPFLNHWDRMARLVVSSAMKSVFRRDKRGEISWGIVRRINIFVKSKLGNGKSGFMRRDVIDVLLELKIKEVDLEKEKAEEMTPKKKMTFEERRMLSKKSRKKAKDMVQLERELLETAAEENKVKKSLYLTGVTELVFTIYFRTLKTNSTGPMLSAVLEGLAKFAHIINVDFFDDLLKVLAGLQNSGDLKRRESILCIATVLAVLDGQGQALTLDPTLFHKNLYSLLIQLKCGRAQTDVGVALRCIRLACGKKKIPGPRAAAFVKRLTTVAMQLEHNDVLGCLMELKNVLKMNPAARGLLDSDGSLGSGIYLPELDNPDHCQAESSTLWELTTLMSHYHPWVPQAVRGILNPDTADALPKDIFLKHPEEIVTVLDPYKSMDFTPELNLPTPAPFKQLRKHGVFQPKTEFFRQILPAQNISEKLYDKYLDSVEFTSSLDNI